MRHILTLILLSYCFSLQAQNQIDLRSQTKLYGSSGLSVIVGIGTAVTVTNQMVTTSSIIFAVIRTNDATARINNVVPAAGSFTINITACTSEVSIGFLVIN